MKTDVIDKKLKEIKIEFSKVLKKHIGDPIDQQTLDAIKDSLLGVFTYSTGITIKVSPGPESDSLVAEFKLPKNHPDNLVLGDIKGVTIDLAKKRKTSTKKKSKSYK